MQADERTERSTERPEVLGSTALEAPGDRPAAPANDGRDAATHERCIHHPSKAAVARCNACEEPICLTCAVPVRGRVLGPECLAVELGEPAIATALEPDRIDAGSWTAVAGAVLALVATAGPWTRTGAGDRLFGAWVPSLRWSMVAAAAAALLVPAVWWFRTHGARSGAAFAIVGGTAIAAASSLAIAFPPTFQVASWGPWVAAIGGAVAVGGGIASTVIGARPGQGV